MAYDKHKSFQHHMNQGNIDRACISDSFEYEKWVRFAEDDIAKGLSSSNAIRRAIQYVSYHPAFTDRVAEISRQRDELIRAGK